jgi:hypothetical protein
VHRFRAEPTPPERRSETPPPAPHELFLGIGNQAVLGMLQVARKGPEMEKFEGHTVTKPELYTTTDEKQWAERVRAKDYFPLYSEIAKLLQADKLEDVKGMEPKDIKGAARENFSYLEQGLNWVSRLGSRGRTGYLYEGKWTAQLPDTPKGDDPQVAVILTENTFDPDNKALTLGILRHELEHAVHNRMAADWLKRWRTSGKAGATPFRAWLKNQSINPADKALVYERLSGGKSSTEALANTEGFMAMFATEKPNLPLADAPAEEELADVARDYWPNAAEDVRTEVIARLQAFGAGLTGDQATRFLATLEKLQPKAPTLFDPLIKGLKKKKTKA